MKNVEYDPKWAVCTECGGQGKFEDGQGQWWLCRTCAGYGSPAARIYGEKHPENIKPATVHGVPPAVRNPDVATLWGGIFYVEG